MAVSKQARVEYSHVDGAAWITPLLQALPQATADAVNALKGYRDLSSVSASTLVLIGSLVSTGIRREILRHLLVKTDFNISHVAELCRTSGPANLIRELRAIGLGPLYDEMRSKGTIKRGVRRKRKKISDLSLAAEDDKRQTLRDLYGPPDLNSQDQAQHDRPPDQ